MAVSDPALPHASVGRVSTDPVAAALPATWNPIYERVDANLAALLGSVSKIVSSTDDLSDHVPAVGHEGSRPTAYVVATGELYVYDPTPFGDRAYVAPAGSVPADGDGVWLVVRAFPPGGYGVQYLVESFEIAGDAVAAEPLFGGQPLVMSPSRPSLVEFCSVDADARDGETGIVVVTATQGGAEIASYGLRTPQAPTFDGARSVLYGRFIVTPNPAGGPVSVTATTNRIRHYGYGQRTLTAQLI